MCPTINVGFIWASSNHQEDRREQDRQNTVIWAMLHHNARFCRLITVETGSIPIFTSLIYKLQLL